MADQLAAFAPRRVLEHDLLGGRRFLTQLATTLFVDLEGFTGLTDRLARFGSRGTEQLSGLLRDFFAQVTDTVTELGGDLVAYGGDALTVVFDGPATPTLDAARSAAAAIGRLSRDVSGVPTLAGPVRLRTRVGIARGEVTTAVARSSRRCIPVNLGPGMDLAVAAQLAADVGGVVVDPHGFEPPTAVGEPRARVRVEDTGSDLEPLPPEPVDPTALAGLAPPLVLDRLASGATLESHRRVSAAFARLPAVSPTDLGPFLADVSALLELVDGWEGELVQVSGGDKGTVAMVVFGAPLAHGDDPVRAVEAMLELRRRVPSVAAGVATGPVFAALLGSRTRIFPTHSGVAAATAARLMQGAAGGQLLVDHQTWAETSGRFRAAGRPTVQRVKGRLDQIEVHSVRGWRRPRPRAGSHAHPPLVGRGPETAALEELLDDVAGGRGGLLTVVGDPGIGKSRMLQEAAERAGTRGFLVAAADVLDQPRGNPREIWRELLGSVFGVSSRAGAKQWQAALAAVLPDADVHPGRLGALLGLRPGAASPALPAGAGTPLDAELADGLLARLLSVASRERPVLLVVDNGERLDDASGRTVAALGRLLSGSRVGVVTTSGSSGPAAGGRSRSTRLVALTQLRAAETEMVAADAWRQAGGGNPPPWLAEAARVRAGGNPYLVRTVTWELKDRWQPGSPPPPVQDGAEGAVGGLLSERIDRLDPDARDLLHVLAAAGRPCGPGLAAVVSGDRLDVPGARRAAARLADEHLVELDVVGDEERYRLPHERLRQMVYASMSHSERDRLHRRLIGCLGALKADPAEVGEHVRRLGDADLARQWFPLAAASARMSWNLADAVAYLEGLQPLLTGAERDEVEVELLEVLLVSGRANDVLRRSADASPASVSAGRSPGLLAARRLHVVAQAAQACGEYDRSERAAVEAMRLADGLDEPLYQRSAELLVVVRSERGKTHEAVTTARSLVARAEGIREAAALTTARAALGAALLLSGRPDEAAAEYEHALTGSRASGDAVQQVHVLSDLAGCAFETGRYADCAGLLAAAREIADRIGYRRHLAFNLSNEAQLRAGLGDPEAAACAAVAIQRSLDMGDLACAANALHTWVSSSPSLAEDASLWRRLASIDGALDRPLLRARDQAWAAVAAARAGRASTAIESATAAETAARELDQPQLLRRAALARLVAEHRDQPASATARAAFVTALDELAAASDADPVERAEVGVERWRATHTPVHHRAAVELVTRAFGVQPSALARSWLRELGAREPEPPPPLPSPAGISGVRPTRAQLADALRRVESALRARDGAQRSE